MGNAQGFPEAAATCSMIVFRKFAEVAVNGKEASCPYSLVANKASAGRENLVQSSNVESGLRVLFL